jgi:hypothetical protein
MINCFRRSLTSFQKEFGYAKQAEDARKRYQVKDKLTFAASSLAATVFGGLGKGYLVCFIGLELVDNSFQSFRINVFELHLCNARMTFPSQRLKALKRLVEIEGKFRVYNWYYHILALERLNDGLHTELSRLYQHPNSEPRVNMAQVLDTVGDLIKLYTASPEEKTSVLLHKQLINFLEIVSSFQSYINYDLNLATLTEIFDLLLTHEKDAEVQETLITLQKFIEWDDYDQICLGLSDVSIDHILSSLTASDRNLSQAAKDVLTFISLSSNLYLRKPPIKTNSISHADSGKFIRQESDSRQVYPL